MKLKVVLLMLALVFTFACGSSNRAGDWEEYNEPCYTNQQPNYIDGDYYIYDCGGRYRRVRREQVHYPVPVYIPVMPDYERERVYRTIPRKSTVPPSRQTGAPDITTGSSSKPSTVPSSRTSPTASKPSTVPSSRSSQPSRPPSSTTSRPSSTTSRPSTVPSSRRN
jgi:hypothetical protein